MSGDQNPFTEERPAIALTPGDLPTEELSPGFKKALRAFLFVCFRAIVDGKITPREKELMRAAGRAVFDELFK